MTTQHPQYLQTHRSPGDNGAPGARCEIQHVLTQTRVNYHIPKEAPRMRYIRLVSIGLIETKWTLGESLRRHLGSFNWDIMTGGDLRREDKRITQHSWLASLHTPWLSDFSVSYTIPHMTDHDSAILTVSSDHTAFMNEHDLAIWTVSSGQTLFMIDYDSPSQYLLIIPCSWLTMTQQFFLGFLVIPWSWLSMTQPF